MDLIKALNPSVAVSILVMDDSDSAASGYGTCWNGNWNGLPAGQGLSCGAGQFLGPKEMYPQIINAAWQRGIPFAPEFSVMDYSSAGHPEVILPKLVEFVNWARPTFGGASLMTTDGRYVVTIDGLDAISGLNSRPDLEAAIYAYMNSQSDILWINNLVTSGPNPQILTNGNVYRAGPSWSSTIGNSAEAGLASQWGSLFLPWFIADYAKDFTDYNNPVNQVPQALREQWMNITPNNPSNYPVFISQWNEYGEFLIWEPSTVLGMANYNYLQWMMSMQP